MVVSLGIVYNPGAGREVVGMTRGISGTSKALTLIGVRRRNKNNYDCSITAFLAGTGSWPRIQSVMLTADYAD